VSRPVFAVLSPDVAQVIPPCAFRTTKAPGGTIHEAKVAMHGDEPVAVALIDHAELAQARAAVEELVEAVRERRRISSHGRQSTGPFAESDARLDAALAKFEPAP
jgi:glycine cleavage system regulatory protein